MQIDNNKKCYTLAYISYFYNVGVPTEKIPDPGDHELNLKLCRSNVVSDKCRNAYYYLRCLLIEHILPKE